jgi:hypothetical protein
MRTTVVTAHNMLLLCTLYNRHHEAHAELTGITTGPTATSATSYCSCSLEQVLRATTAATAAAQPPTL